MSSQLRATIDSRLDSGGPSSGRRRSRERAASSMWRAMGASTAVGVSALALAHPATAQCTTTRVNLGPPGIQGNGDSNLPSISADGRFVAFQSSATNLMPGNTNPMQAHIYVRDRQSGQIERVSVDSSGVLGNNSSSQPFLSAGGRYVSFSSDATNLVPADTNWWGDAFVHDRQTGQTERISMSYSGVQGDSASYAGPITSDGRYVLIGSEATNLVPGDLNACGDSFLFDRVNHQIERVDVSSAGVESNSGSSAGSISDDGRYVAFESSGTNLVPADTNGVEDVFVRDRWTGLTTRASVNSLGAEANEYSWYAAISANGRYVTFTSGADNLVPGIGSGEIFLHDLQTQQTTCASISSAGIPAASFCLFPTLSADGRFVCFRTSSDNLVPGDTNNMEDFFVHDRQTAQTQRVSVSSAGDQANGEPQFASISADGRWVAFDNDATNLVPGDTNGRKDVFVHDRQSAETTSVTVEPDHDQANDVSSAPAVSDDGRYVAFASDATNLAIGDTNGTSDVFVHDAQANSTTRVSVDAASVQGNGPSFEPVLSADGRCVAFLSFASNLVPADTYGHTDVFVRDLQSGQITRVSVSSSGAEANSGSLDRPSLSADGRCVAFASYATNLVLGDNNLWTDVFVHDRQTAQTTRVSASSSGAQGNGRAEAPAISADGGFVAFHSYASNLVAGDTNGDADVFVHDRATGQTTRASEDVIGIGGDALSLRPSISGDGRYVAFYCGASNLVPNGQANGWADIVVKDRISGTVECVSVDASGTEADGPVDRPSGSADGRLVVFESRATNLVASDTNGLADIVERDRVGARTRLVSAAATGISGNGDSTYARVSSNGRYVAFLSDSDDLVQADFNGKTDVFVHDRLGCSVDASTYCTAKVNSLGCTPLIEGSSAGSFTITASLLVPNKNGLLFYGFAPLAAPFQNGIKCVAPPTVRTPLKNSGGASGCSGVIAYDMGARIASGVDPHLVPGARVYAQVWTRSNIVVYAIDLTAGLEFTVAY
jgi:hypothetical protein